MPQAHFAETLGVRVETVNRWERGRTFPSYKQQAKLRVLEEMIRQRKLRRRLDRPGMRYIDQRASIKRKIEEFLNAQKGITPQEQKEPAPVDQPKSILFDI
jgi:transcriptional regulator with XRE-family HTH domain